MAKPKRPTRKRNRRAARITVLPTLFIKTRYGQPAEAVTAAQLKNHLGSVLRTALTRGVVAITRYQQVHAMLLSVEEYQTLLEYAPPALKMLKKEFDARVASMQTKKSKRAGRPLFGAAPSQHARSAAKQRTRIGK